MSEEYTRYDWACDRESRVRWADEEERLMASIDRKMRKSGRRTNHKSNRKNWN